MDARTQTIASTASVTPRVPVRVVAPRTVELTKIFKKPPGAADSKPVGRDVAKDIIEIAGDCRILDVKLTDAELAGRKTKSKPRATDHTTGAHWTYAQQAGPAGESAAPHPGRAHEKHCYADS